MIDQTAPLRENKRRAWIVFVGCCLLMIGVFSIHGTCSTLLVAPVTEQMGYSRAQFTLGISIGSILQIFTAPIVGKAISNKKIGSRGVISIAVVLFAATYMLLSRATALWQWQVGFALTGVFQVFCASVPVQILLNNWFKDRLGTVIGLSAGMTGIGSAVLSPVFTNIIATYGWRTACFAMGIVTLVIGLPLTATILKLTPQESGFLPYTSDKHAASTSTAASAEIELKGLTRAQALKTPAFYFAFIASVLFGFSAAINTHAPSIAAGAFGVVAMGTMVSLFSVCAALGKVIIGAINDKFGITFSSLFGVIGMAGGTLLLIISSHAGSIVLMYAAFALIGLGGATNTLTPPLMVTAGMGRKHFGDIYGLIVPAFVVGVAVGIPMSGLIYDKSGTYDTALISIIAFSVVAFICAIVSARMGKKAQDELK